MGTMTGAEKLNEEKRERERETERKKESEEERQRKRRKVREGGKCVRERERRGGREGDYKVNARLGINKHKRSSNMLVSLPFPILLRLLLLPPSPIFPISSPPLPLLSFLLNSISSLPKP